MPGPKTNEREGTRAVLRHARVSAYKVREVLDLVRNKPVAEAQDILRFTERDAGILVGKLLNSAIANASHNDQQDPEELYVSACFADEGTTIKRWRPRARGRATRIRKRTCHITVIVSRLPDADLVRLHARREAEQAARRSRRVAGARKADAAPSGGGRGLRTRVRPQRGRPEAAHDHDHDHDHDEADATVTSVTPAITAPAKATPPQPEPEPVATDSTEAVAEVEAEVASDENEKGE
ncbi:MAG: large subunit ribosomal protein [Acidimicrobiaceae bacterium]|jgi:large subunit ribosomal protein L22|nr:large subunit ribosomal protein [Acidimicrobiaceae bacterium]